MKKNKVQKIYVLIDNNNSSVDKNGSAYGWYFFNEKDLCEKYCKQTGLRYVIKEVSLW